MGWHELFGFWIVSILLVLTPGADWAYCISAGIAGSVIRQAVAGLLLGYVLLTALVAAGVAALIASIPYAMGGLTVVGAAYLVYLGVGLIRTPPTPRAEGSPPPSSPRAWLYKGLYISGLNPKALLLFLALLPQFTRANADWPASIQLAVLGIVHAVNCGVVYSIVGQVSNTVLRRASNAGKVVGRASGATMIILAAVLIVERLVG